MKNLTRCISIGKWIILGMFTINFATAQGASILLGDVDGNGQVTMLDASLALQCAQAKKTLSADQLSRANVTGEVGCTADDAKMIGQYVVGSILQFPSSTATYTFSTSAGLNGTIGVNGISS